LAAALCFNEREEKGKRTIGKKMELARLKRYKDKLNLVSRRIQEIQEWLKEFLEEVEMWIKKKSSPK
jgi:hypothetical protein